MTSSTYALNEKFTALQLLTAFQNLICEMLLNQFCY